MVQGSLWVGGGAAPAKTTEKSESHTKKGQIDATIGKCGVTKRSILMGQKL